MTKKVGARTRVYVSMVVAVTGEKTLRRYAEGLNDGFDADTPLGDVVGEATSNPIEAPLDAGYEIVGRHVRREAPGFGRNESGLFRVTVCADVFDAKAMAKATRAAEKKCYGVVASRAFGTGRERDPSRMLYELQVASNAGPAPVEVGFEVVSVVDGETARELYGRGDDAPDVEGTVVPVRRDARGEALASPQFARARALAERVAAGAARGLDVAVSVLVSNGETHDFVGVGVEPDGYLAFDLGGAGGRTTLTVLPGDVAGFGETETARTAGRDGGVTRGRLLRQPDGRLAYVDENLDFTRADLDGSGALTSLVATGMFRTEARRLVDAALADLSIETGEPLGREGLGRWEEAFLDIARARGLDGARHAMDGLGFRDHALPDGCEEAAKDGRD